MKEDLIPRTFVAKVKGLSLNGDRLKIDIFENFRNHIFLLNRDNDIIL